MPKATSILLSLLMLLSTTGLTYGQHFCEGIRVDKSLALGFEAMNCDDVAEDNCETTPGQDDCCADVYIQVQTDKEFSTQGNYFVPDWPASVAVAPIFLYALVPYQTEQPLFTFYAPPESHPDTLALYQIYLI